MGGLPAHPGLSETHPICKVSVTRVLLNFIQAGAEGPRYLRTPRGLTRPSCCCSHLTRCPRGALTTGCPDPYFIRPADDDRVPQSYQGKASGSLRDRPYLIPSTIIGPARTTSHVLWRKPYRLPRRPPEQRRTCSGAGPPIGNSFIIWPILAQASYQGKASGSLRDRPYLILSNIL